jgi:glycosyltransferase involved in cell wall biosynthesis
MTMRILQLAYTPLDHEPPVFALGSALVDAGHKVLCVGYGSAGRTGFSRICHGYHLHRVLRPELRRTPRFLRGAIRVANYWRGILHIIKRWIPDLIVAHNYDVLPLALYIGKRSHAPVIYYCTEYTAKPGIKELLIGWGVLKAIEPFIVRRCSVVISVEPNRAILQAREWKRAIDCVILNAPRYDNSFAERASARLEDRSGPLRFVYAGRIGEEQCIDELISAAASGGFHLDLYGPVDSRYEPRFHSTMKPLRDKSNCLVAYRGQVDYQELQNALISYDVGVCLYNFGRTNTQLAAPAKLLEYMRSGLAVLTSGQPTPRQMVGSTRCGIVVESCDAEHLRLAMEQLSSLGRAGVKQLGTAGLAAFHLSLNYQAQAMELMQWVMRYDQQRTSTPFGSSLAELR